MTATNAWNQLKSYQTTDTVQKFLEKCYQKSNQSLPAELSYQNSYPFVYHLKHAENFYLSAENASLPVKPMLLFYGMAQLIKACILTKDPEYPAASSVLAHGVSSRKRKKQHYRFLQDEVKIQRNGLFAHAAFHLYSLQHVENDKYSMHELLQRVPELCDLFKMHKQKEVHIAIGVDDQHIHLPKDAAASYHMTPDRMLDYLHHHFQLDKAGETSDVMSLLLPESFNAFSSPPFLYNQQTCTYSLPASLNDLAGLPEFLAHYLLLYNLSMISRYETEWWYELMLSHSQDDYVFIVRFLEATKDKIPQMALTFLNQMREQSMQG